MKDIVKRLIVVGTFSLVLPVTLMVAKHTENNFKPPAVSGTYQLYGDEISLNSRGMDSLRYIIEAKRKENDVVILDITPSTKVKILPRKEILSTSFKPVDEFVFTNRKVKHVYSSHP